MILLNKYIGALLTAALVSCVSRGELAAHALRHRPPGAAAEAWSKYRAAGVAGNIEEAEAQLRTAVGIDPEFVRAWRRLQDIQIITFRRDEAIREAEAGIAKDPNSPRGYYLLARLRDGAARLRLLKKAQDLDPWYGWARQGRSAYDEAFSGPGDGLSYAQDAVDLLPEETDPWLGVIASLRASGDQGRLEFMVRNCAHAFGGTEPVFLELLLRMFAANANRPGVYTIFNQNDVRDNLSIILQNAPATRALALAARAGGTRDAIERLEDALVCARSAGPVAAELEVARCLLAAEIALQSGRVTDEERELSRAHALGEHSIRVVRELRLARIATRDYKGAWSLEEEFLQQFGNAIKSADNGRRDQFAASLYTAANMPGDANVLLSFARAAARNGWLDEAAELAAQTLQLDPTSFEAAEFHKEVRGFRRMITKVRDELEHGSRGSLSLMGALDPFRLITKETLGFDAVEGSETDAHFPIGSLLVSTPGSPGFASIFEKYGLELRLGKRFLGPVEAAAMRRLSTRAIDGEVLGRPYRGLESVGEGWSLFTQIEQNAGPFAGATLPGNVWIILDEIAETAHGIERERIAMADEARAGRADAWKVQILPLAATKAERLAADESFDLARRLTRRAIERDPSPVAPRMLEIVRLHEYGHLADAEQLLPFMSQLPRAIWWLIDGGLSIRNVEARLEWRAELVALCSTRDPELSLAGIVQHCEHPYGLPPHSIGFSKLAASFTREVDSMAADGALPTIDRRFPILPQIWRLSSDEIHKVALVLARREGLVRE
ncbi:MAG: hypothetical protein HY286_13410 [Planctomycetes bacterium]|nr:hypothetical protein [Planctomycetota bacterium]